MLDRIRDACAQGYFKLHETVNVGATYIDDNRKDMSRAKRGKPIGSGRGSVGKVLVASARERKGKCEG